MKIKRKGVYNYDLGWHQNHGGIVVAKAAEAAIVRNENIEQFIRNHVNVDPMDFMLRAKVPRSADLTLETPVKWGEDTVLTRTTKLPNITRYFVSNSGGALVKIMEPTELQCETWLNTPHWRHKKTGKHKCAKKAPSGMYEQIQAPSERPPDRKIGIEAGFLVTECNRMTDHMRTLPDINIAYYVEKTRKIVEELMQ